MDYLRIEVSGFNMKIYTHNITSIINTKLTEFTKNKIRFQHENT